MNKGAQRDFSVWKRRWKNVNEKERRTEERREKETREERIEEGS